MLITDMEEEMMRLGTLSTPQQTVFRLKFSWFPYKENLKVFLKEIIILDNSLQYCKVMLQPSKLKLIHIKVLHLISYYYAQA